MLVDIVFYLFQLFNHILVDTGEEVLCLGLAILDLGLCLDGEVLGLGLGGQVLGIGLVSSGLDHKSGI